MEILMLIAALIALTVIVVISILALKQAARFQFLGHRINSVSAIFVLVETTLLLIATGLLIAYLFEA